MRKVRRIEISTRRLVDEGVAGEYHSVFKGRGMEFSEVRPYQPGDDIRTIDWNVTARMGTPFVKQYVESRDLTVFVVVDVSGSQNFGSRTILKREQAAEIAALLSFAALRNQDRVGAALVSDRLELFLTPRRSRTHVLRLVREILSRQGHGETDLDAAMPPVLRNLKQRSVLFLISDFVETPFSEALKGRRRTPRSGDDPDLRPSRPGPAGGRPDSRARRRDGKAGHPVRRALGRDLPPATGRTARRSPTLDAQALDRPPGAADRSTLSRPAGLLLRAPPQEATAMNRLAVATLLLAAVPSFCQTAEEPLEGPPPEATIEEFLTGELDRRGHPLHHQHR